MTKLFVLSFMTITFFSTAQANMKEKVKTACAEEITAAGCSSDMAGKKLMQCLRGYKKANKSFKFGPTCKEAIDKVREARKERRAEKK